MAVNAKARSFPAPLFFIHILSNIDGPVPPALLILLAAWWHDGVILVSPQLRKANEQLQAQAAQVAESGRAQAAGQQATSAVQEQCRGLEEEKAALQQQVRRRPGCRGSFYP